MVVPLIGMLAALGGTAALGQGVVMPWLRERERKSQGRTMQGLLAGLPEGAGADQTARALAEGGLLDAGQLMQYGFGQEGRGEQFGYQSMLDEQGFGYDLALEQMRQEMEGRGKYNEKVFALDEAYQPQFEGLSSQMGRLNQMGSLLTDIAGLDPDDMSSWFGGSEEGRQARSQLQQLAAEDYYAWETAILGGKEPNEGTRKELQQAYDVFQLLNRSTLGEPGTAYVRPEQVKLAIDIVDRRREDVERQAQETRGRYYRARDRIEYGGMGGYPELFGGDVEIGRGAAVGEGDEGITRSDRNLIGMESGGDWGATNAQGMAGRAQFSPDRLDEVRQALGRDFSTEAFLRDPGLQRAAEAWHFADIEDFIEEEGLDRFRGESVLGIPVTRQGMLNVAHLGGKRGLKTFLASGGRYDPADANGTRLSDYLQMGLRGG